MFNQTVPNASLIACPDCDLVQRAPALAAGVSVHCARCDQELWRQRESSVSRTLALTLAAAVLFAVASAFPMLGLEAVGREASTTVAGGARQLWRDGREIVAVLVFLTAIVAPGLQIAFLLAICAGARQPRPARWVAVLLRHQPATRIWSMIEVMLLGVLVALIKIAELATVVPGVALYALGALVVLFAVIQASFDPHEIWQRMTWAAEPPP